jgi:hypothetical protein
VLSKVVLNCINICIIINSLKTNMIWKLDKRYCKFYVFVHLYVLYGNLCTFIVSEHFVLHNEAIAQRKSQTSTVSFSYWSTNCVLSGTSIEVWLWNYVKFTNLPSNVYFLLTMIAFSCALYNIITGTHFVKYWVPGGGGE